MTKIDRMSNCRRHCIAGETCPLCIGIEEEVVVQEKICVIDGRGISYHDSKEIYDSSRGRITGLTMRGWRQCWSSSK